jgi:signal transduction histidine kinase
MHLAAGVVASLVVAALLAAYIARPVRRLREALQAGASGQLATDLADTMGPRRDELADLCRDFDRMAHHIDQLMQGQRRLMHDVSHEMRSPLARLSAIVGLVRQQPERLDDCLNLLEHESARMDRLVSELLTLSRLESGMVATGEDVFDLADVLADVVADAAPEAGQTACRIDLDAGEEALVRGDAEMLHRVFDNLLRNALAYAASGGWIGLRLDLEGKEVRVCVEDRGPGVLSSDLDRLFDPFFRGSHVPVKKGHGLGLAIASRIVANHGGSIVAENRREGGLRITVRLPRVSAEESTASG